MGVVETLKNLVRIPSVNPMGRPVSGDIYLEHRMTEYLEQRLAKLGVPVMRQAVEADRCNLFARLDGDPSVEDGGRVVLLDAHQDTVPVDGMVIAPFEPADDGQRITGRGSCDIKGGLACLLTVFERLCAERPRPRPTVVLSFTMNEEYGFTGARQVPRVWREPPRFVPRAPDDVIVAEPTELNVVVAHKGVVRWKCHTRGRAAHSSRPNLGVNAIYSMARVISAGEQYASSIVPTLGEHPRVGSPTMSIGVISGGISVNTVPDQCTIEIDRRVLPAEDPIAARQHVVDYLATHAEAVASEHDAPYIVSSGLADARNESLAARLAAISRDVGGPGEIIGVPYGTNAPAFADEDIPTVVFGPGSIDQAHTTDEWIAIDQLELATRILDEFVRRSAS